MKKEAQDFLWYICLGITRKEMTSTDEESKTFIMKKCADRAYRDFCRTLNFRDSKSNSNDSEDSFQNSISYEIVEQINKKILPCSAENFDNVHDEVCRYIMDLAQNHPKDSDADNKTLLVLPYASSVSQKVKSRGELSFYYGQAQKWLNMTLKYMWLTGIWDKDLERLKFVLHAPIDNYILDGAKSSLGISKRSSLSWSKWNNDDYKKYQKELRAKIKDKHDDTPDFPQTPLEWENDAWIRAADKDR